MIKQRQSDHKLLSGEDFTLNDIIGRIEDDDPDFTSLSIRQTGQNMKDVEMRHAGDDGDGEGDEDEGELMESITLVLPAHLTNTKLQELTSSIAINTSLHSLDLRGNLITDESAVALANAFKQNYAIQNLNLSRNRITSTGAAALVQLVNKCLVRLNLSYNAIGDAGEELK